MIHEPATQIARNARKATDIGDDEKSPDRQRGMWSFLTWSFFLAQAVAAHEAFAKGHAAMDDGETGAGADVAGDANAAQNALANLGMLGDGGLGLDASAAAKLAAMLAAGLLSPQAWSALAADPAAFKAFVDALSGPGGGVGGVAQDGDDVAHANDGSHDSDGGGDTGGGVPGGPGGELPGGGAPPIDGGIDIGVELPGIHLPVLDITLPGNVLIDLGLGGLDVELGDLLGLGVSPNGASVDLLGIANLQLGGGSLLTLGSGDEGSLGHLVGGVGHSLDVLQGIGLGDAVGNTFHVVSPLTAAITSAAAPVMDVLADAQDLLGGSGVLASGGSLVTSVAGGLLSPLNEMMSNGQYTAYGMAVQASGGNEDANGHIDANLHTDAGDVVALADTLVHDLGSGLGTSLGHLVHSD
jgi:hypothetical protein